MSNHNKTKSPLSAVESPTTKAEPTKPTNVTTLTSNASWVGKITPIHELTMQPMQTDWLIKDYIPCDETVMLFGKPEAGKSLKAQDMSYCVSTGKDYHGHSVSQGNVVYVAGEGSKGLNKRFRALAKHNNQTATNVWFTNSSIDLSNSKSTQEFIDDIRDISNIKMVVFDSYNRNTTGEENSAKEVAVVMQHCDQIRLATGGATMLFVHHCGLSDLNRPRGSTAIHAALDVEYKITKKGNDVVMKCTKAKDIERPMDKSFTLTMVDLGKTTDGSNISAPVLTSFNNVIKKKTVSGVGNLIFDHLKVALDKSGLKLSGDEVFNTDKISNVQCEPSQRKIHKDNLFDECEKDISVKSKDDATEPTIRSSKRKSFNRSLKKLIGSGLVAKDKDGYLIIPSSVEEDEIP